MNRDALMLNALGLRVGAVLIVGSVALTACGSSSNGSSAASSTNSAVPSNSAAPTSTPPISTSGGGSNSGSSFCTYAKAQKVQAAAEVKAFESDSPAQLDAFVQRALGALEAYTSTAPSAIKADVAVAVAADQTVFEALKKAHYNYKDVSPSTFEGINTPRLKRATAAIVAYLASSCGISPSAAPTG